MRSKAEAPLRVLLPKRLWEDARNKEHFKQLLADYMKKYPNYIVKAVKDQMAICERNE